MLVWLVVAFVALVGGGLLARRAASRRHELPAARGLPALPAADSHGNLLGRTLRDLRAGDVLQHDGRDYLVEGVVTYDEDGHTWKAARASDGRNERWFSVDLDRGAPLDVRVLEASPEVEVNGPPPDTLELRGQSYRLSARGGASITVAGDVGELGRGLVGVPRCRWWRYAAPGNRVIVVELWGETWRALAGVGIRADDVELLAAS